MAYTKQNFTNGEILTHTKLNAMDDQIALNESGKVDKVTGKGLSTNDYDNAEKLNLKITSEALLAETKKLRNIIALNKDVTFTETADTTTAMTKTVPANAQSYAEARKIGGKTQVVSGELKSAAVTAVKSYGSGSVLIDTKTIPAAVQALPGYGWSAGTVCNEIDWVNRKYIQRVAGIDLGSLDWYDNQGVRFMSYFPGDARSVIGGELICVKYTKGETHPDYGGQDKNASVAGENIYIRDTDYTDAAAFKAANAGVMLYYELATPIETDISGMLTADNMIAVEAGGSIVFENANSMAMPNTVAYMVKAGE